jgi:hypothetical protein
MTICWCVKESSVSSFIACVSIPELEAKNMHIIDHVDKLTKDLMDNVEAILNNRPEPISDYYGCRGKNLLDSTISKS